MPWREETAMQRWWIGMGAGVLALAAVAAHAAPVQAAGEAGAFAKAKEVAPAEDPADTTLQYVFENEKRVIEAPLFAGQWVRDRSLDRNPRFGPGAGGGFGGGRGPGGGGGP